jgi:hypothetical protein
MRTTRLICFVAAVLLGVFCIETVRAALPPAYERWRQLGAVVAQSAIPAKLAAHGVVDRIEWVDASTYRVRAGRCYVDASLKFRPLKPGFVGPAEIDRVEIAEAQCQ